MSPPTRLTTPCIRLSGSSKMSCKEKPRLSSGARANQVPQRLAGAGARRGGSMPSPAGVAISTNIRWLQLSPPDLFAALTARLLTLRFTPPPNANVRRGQSKYPGNRCGLRATAATQRARSAASRNRAAQGRDFSLAQPTSAGTPPSVGRDAQRRPDPRARDRLRTLPDSQNAILQLLDRVQQSVVEAEHRADGTVQIDPGDLQTTVR